MKLLLKIHQQEVRNKSIIVSGNASIKSKLTKENIQKFNNLRKIQKKVTFRE